MLNFGQSAYFDEVRGAVLEEREEVGGVSG